MNSAVLIGFGIVYFIFAYFWYGGVIKKRVLGSDDSIETPSHTMYDGNDYVPTKSPILFGHHFSSIAGAGPIVGPILAFALFGWLPALIWIVVASVFMGAVHDYTALIISARSKGVSIVDIAGTAISPKARSFFAVFVWLTLILVQAVFADLTAKTIVEKPEIAIPTFGLLFLAMGFGYLVYRKNAPIAVSTIIALIFLFGLILLGNAFPLIASYQTWLILTMVYVFIASVIPVWILLQPRDYLSMYILIIGLVIGFVGMLILRPEITAPAFISFDSKIGPMFPMLFITIACGAISGFHAIVSSGTSAKQLDKESDGQKVAFGGMLTEGALALLVTVMVASVLTWAPGSSDLNSFQGLLGKSANIVFGVALAKSVAVLGIPFEYGTQFGILMLNAFILTSLDTASRLNRYIVTETLGVKYGGLFSNKYFATGISVILSYIMCVANGYQVIWPVFGASNQLIATLALFVISAWLFSKGKPKWYTLIPGFIMLIITELALIYQALFMYYPNGNYILVAVALILFVLGIIISIEATKKVFIKSV